VVHNGLGRDIWTLNDNQITNVLYYYYLGEISYVVGLGISKIAILSFYLRVFPAKEFRMKIYAVMGLAIAYTIAFSFATVFQCIPVSTAWNQWDGLHKGKCNNVHRQGWVAGAINIVLDTLVMILPMNNLNMKLKQKLMVMSIVSVGIIVLFTSAMRLYSLVKFANSQNVTWDYVGAGYWSLLEIDVSIICGCMPALRLLMSMTLPKIKSTLRSSKGDSQPSTFSNSSQSTGTDNKHMASISITPTSGDESDFVPLVDIEPGDRFGHSKDPHPGTEHKVHSNHVDHEHLDGWPMPTAIMNKEHVEVDRLESQVCPWPFPQHHY